MEKLGTARDEKPKETIKVVELNKDAGSRRDYKLTSQTKFEHFMDYLSSELRSNDLFYVIDAKAGKSLTLDEELREGHKHKVRDILINRIDAYYHKKVAHIKDPVELLNKIRELKRCKVNVTSVTLRQQLYSIKYFASKEKIAEFLDRFEEILRNYDSIQ